MPFKEFNSHQPPINETKHDAPHQSQTMDNNWETASTASDYSGHNMISDEDTQERRVIEKLFKGPLGEFERLSADDIENSGSSLRRTVLEKNTQERYLADLGEIDRVHDHHDGTNQRINNSLEDTHLKIDRWRSKVERQALQPEDVDLQKPQDEWRRHGGGAPLQRVPSRRPEH